MEKRKRHFKVGEVKSKILEIILEHNGPIKETDVQTLLRDKFELFNQSTINRHLKYLNEHDCIERVSSVEKSRSSFWDVETFEQLKNIRSEFENIKLNNYEKAIAILLKQNGYVVSNLNGFFIYIQLLLSNSFFNTCIDTNMEVLISRIGNIYVYKGALGHRIIDEQLEESYTFFKKHFPNIELSIEEFSHELTTLSKKPKDIPSIESLKKLWKENMRKYSTGTIDEMSEEIKKDNVEFYLKIYHYITLVWIYSKGYEDSFFSLLFEGFFYQDVLTGTSSKEEINFALETKANYEEYNALDIHKKDLKDGFLKMVFGDLKQASSVMFNHKQPSLFDNKVYENEAYIYKALKQYFNIEIQKLSESL